MGRKAKNNFSKAVTITESNIRMNFLYQASNLLAYTISKEIHANTNNSSSTGKKDKTLNKKKSNSNIAKDSKNKLIKKRKRVPLRKKRNKHLSELYKNTKCDEIGNENGMDVDSTTNDKSSSEVKDKKLCSILNKDYPLLPLARYYNTTLGVVAQKTVSRM
ncbi:hypothetical protein PIROE2DRAFT_15813 [Piromyces sp. E2]|nr:hypothetical protein PIROE2DRAFT_15813 [Piromyces sp. E2]|eukprot:OUM58822.1 hypothetical protein PIROE2DRAFT_15813 [Piromyces sp. E2]